MLIDLILTLYADIRIHEFFHFKNKPLVLKRLICNLYIVSIDCRENHCNVFLFFFSNPLFYRHKPK